MSWLSKAGKNIAKEYKRTERNVSKAIPHSHSGERRAALESANEQISYYKQEKEAAEKSRREADEEKKRNRQETSQKEIRAKKATYRRGGFMETPSSEPKEKLG